MPDQWLERPRVLPHRCAISGRSKPEDGPYYEFPLEYQTEDDGPTQRLCISAKYLLAPFDKPGAPFRVSLEGSEVEANARADAAEAERDELELRLREAEAELEAQANVFSRARARSQAKAPARRRPAAKKAEDEE